MDRRSRSTESNYRSRRSYRRRSISRSRSKSRSRRYNRSRTRSWSRSRSRSREREFRRNRQHERDPYKETSSRSNRYHHHHRSGSSNRGGGGGDNAYRGGGSGGGGGGRNREDSGGGTRLYENKERPHNNNKKQQQQHYYTSPQHKDEHSDSYESDGHYYDQYTPNNTIIVRGLAQHITEADISCDLMQYNLVPLSIRLIRKRKTGTSRGFAFVEFSIKEEAMLWMQHKQGMLLLNDMLEPAKMQYSHSKEPIKEQKILSDWYCAKCGVFNFKRREVCFKCFASREESEKGGEGSDEISNILTKKIMLRNLDVLTNEECVLTVMQEKIPRQVEKITKILVCRDPLTQTSRGICYLYFDNLVDSMNTHNSLKALEPPLAIEDREVIVTYCMDTENKHIIKPSNISSSSIDISTKIYSSNSIGKQNTYRYTTADVPRLAEYSASMYASSQAEKEYYYKYYTNYYLNEISKGQFTNLPTMNQLSDETSANSGAAVALSAIQRKQSKSKEHQQGNSGNRHHHNNNSNKTAQIDNSIGFIPDKQYPPPDITSYQYDETSGYYYDPMTKLYYDSNSQYFYNNDTASYLYYDSEKQKYLAVPTTTTSDDINSATITAAATINIDNKDNTNNKKHDKVKVAKKIVKDMEKWAKQLNQKKDMNFCAPTVVSSSSTKTITNSSSTINLNNNNNDTNTLRQLISNSNSIGGSVGSGYADVCYSILENKDKLKLMDNIEPIASSSTSDVNRIVTMYNSDSDDNNHDDNNHHHSLQGTNNNTEKDYVDFDKLTCLLCKRAFQSQDILNKHLKMSKLHKENLQKYNLNNSSSDNKYIDKAKLEYRDRAKERRLKYGECDPPPINRSKERFEKQLESVSTVVQSNLVTQTPISENNVGNRLLQKMGWQEGQGLGKKNQGRTNIVETDGRNSSAGLGAKVSSFGPGDDYKSYIKRMMKSRYEQS